MNPGEGVKSMFSGSIPALVTPFTAGAVDEGAYRDLVEWQISEGTHGLVACGTTGESATLSDSEHRRLIELTVGIVGGRMPVIAGCGANATDHAVALTRAAKEAGADAALHVPPYYNRPNQDGIFLHISRVAEVGLPIVLYNVPGRTVTDISVETMARLAELPEVVGVKDATGSIARVSAQRAACGPDFVQLSGNDDTALAFNATGGRGCISVTANVAPRLCAEFQEATLAGDHARALELHDRLFPLHVALFTDASPGPVKYALSRVRPGFPQELRPPMTPAGEVSRRAVDAALAHAGLV